MPEAVLDNNPIGRARDLLRQYFGYDGFRSVQEDIIKKVLDGKDCIVLMPTGGGKSICYQIPALLVPGTAVVVSPLISLMKDQVEGLKANGIKAAFLNSSLSGSEQREVEQRALNDDLDLLYVSPERLVSASFFQFLEQIKVSLFAIDEAHCISQWGHDFRPEYTQMNALKKNFPDVPVVALTATADRLTQKDIAEQLYTKKPEVFIDSFNRPNLSLAVLPGHGRTDAVTSYVKSRSGQPGIVYCLARKTTEKLAEKLQKEGVSAQAYHAGLSSKERNRVQEDFINDKTDVICATIAFGMGIDKSNVRFILHFNLPKNIESFYQEIGRAGRDGSDSETILFYSMGDVFQLRMFIEESPLKDILLMKLRRMQDYAEAVQCRRKLLLSYFGEQLEGSCGNCDVCKNPPAVFDGTKIAQKALSAVARMDRMKKAAGMNLLINTLRGSNRHDVLQQGLNKIKTYGAGKDHSFDEWQQYILQLINQGLLDIAYDQHAALKLTPASQEILFKGKKVELVKAKDKKEKEEQFIKKEQKTKKQQQQEALFERLRQLRMDIASSENIAPYQVFHDKTLHEMTEKLPACDEQMSQISGMGKYKLEKYAALFSKAIIDFVAEEMGEGKRVRGGTYIYTWKLINEGLSPQAVAAKRQIHEDTIFSHLARLVSIGFPVEVKNYLNEAHLNDIKTAMEKTGATDEAKPVVDFLNDRLSYGKVRLGMAVFGKGNR